MLFITENRCVTKIYITINWKYRNIITIKTVEPVHNKKKNKDEKYAHEIKYITIPG